MQYFILSGLCKTSSLDIYYGLSKYFDENTKKYDLIGYTDSILQWQSMEWELSVYGKSKVKAFNNESRKTYPLPVGIRNWYIQDTCGDGINPNKVHKIQLSISRCNANEFVCQDGTW